jgi:hypothetical protein
MAKCGMNLFDFSLFNFENHALLSCPLCKCQHMRGTCMGIEGKGPLGEVPNLCRMFALGAGRPCARSRYMQAIN